jgi:tRNA 2-selenouridine synthase SelU
MRLAEKLDWKGLIRTVIYQNQCLHCSAAEFRDAGPALSSATVMKYSLIIGGFLRLRKTIVRTAKFWVIKQRIAVIPYLLFGTICQSHLQGLSKKS